MMKNNAVKNLTEPFQERSKDSAIRRKIEKNQFDLNCFISSTRKNIGTKSVLHVFIVVEVVHTLHRVPSDSDVVEHQTVYQPVLHPPEDLRLPQHAGGGNGDVLEGDPEHVSWVSPILVRISPGLDSFTEL